MRQLTPIDAPTGSQRLPSDPPEAPLTARDRPRTHRGRKFLLAIAVVILLAAAATVVLARDGGSPTGGGDGSPDPELAAKLVAATIPDGAAFEPELVAEVGEAGARIRTAWSPAATSLTCDVAADPPVAAERHRLAVAAAEYTATRTGIGNAGFRAAAARLRRGNGELGRPAAVEDVVDDAEQRLRRAVAAEGAAGARGAGRPAGNRARPGPRRPRSAGRPPLRR